MVNFDKLFEGGITCPGCKTKLRSQTPFGAAKSPRKGDRAAFICICCYAVLVVDEDLAVRKMTFDEKMNLMRSDPRGFSSLLEALSMTIKYMEERKTKEN